MIFIAFFVRQIKLRQIFLIVKCYNPIRTINIKERYLFIQKKRGEYFEEAICNCRYQQRKFKR